MEFTQLASMIWTEHMGNAKAVFTIGEVAEILRVHPTTIYRLLKRGEFPGFKVGGNWRIGADALKHWISEVGFTAPVVN
jgi:excisionase family DNA binding protein